MWRRFKERLTVFFQRVVEVVRTVSKEAYDAWYTHFLQD